jgi:hypothetical protein
MMILAQALNKAERFKALHQRFSEPDPEVGSQIAAVLCILGITVFIIWILAHVQRHRQFQESQPSPMGVYRRVIGKLGLNFAQRYWLWRLAKASGAPHPTSLLISSMQYDEAVGLFCEKRSMLTGKSTAVGHFSAVRERLFGAAHPDVETSGEAI